MSTFNLNYSDLISQLTQAQEDANQANLQRYGELLGHIDGMGQQIGAMGTYGQAQDMIANVGNAASERIEQGRVRQGALADQDLVSRGLGNTTIRSSAQRGVNEDSERLQGENDERVATMQSGLLERRAGQEYNVGALKAGAIEGRFDNGPDLGLYAQLLQASAAAGDQSQIQAFVPNNPQNGSAPGSSIRAGGGGGGGNPGAPNPAAFVRGGGGGGSGYATSIGGGGSGNIGSYASAPSPQVGGGAATAAGQAAQGAGQVVPQYGGAQYFMGGNPEGTNFSQNLDPGTGFASGQAGTVAVEQPGGPIQGGGGATGGTGSEGGSTGGGGQSITIYAGSKANAPYGSSKTTSIPAGMTPLEAMEKGLIPYGWNINPK